MSDNFDFIINFASKRKTMGKIKMLGALAGDIIGSVYEFCNTKSTDFDLFCGASNFTDDSVMTLAVAKWLLEDSSHTIHKTLDEALALAAVTASVSHNHPEGVKGAQAIATSVFLCKQGKSKQEIKEYVEKTFGYNLNRSIADIRPRYEFDVSCQGSVPEAIIAFLEANSFEEVIRLAISLGGDSDTIGAMAGAIAACMYPIPDEIAERCDSILTEDLREIKDRFCEFIEKRKG